MTRIFFLCNNDSIILLVIKNRTMSLVEYTSDIITKSCHNMFDLLY
jgi:hypothetical protein